MMSLWRFGGAWSGLRLSSHLDLTRNPGAGTLALSRLAADTLHYVYLSNATTYLCFIDSSNDCQVAMARRFAGSCLAHFQ